MNILVTGGAGYIGSHVVLALKEKGVKVTVIDDLSTGNINLIPKEVNFLNCNINDNDKVDKLLKSESFNAVMHFAANIKVEESVKNPKKYFINNTDNAISFFETCYKNNLTNIIFSSTAAVYGNSKTNNLIRNLFFYRVLMYIILIQIILRQHLKVKKISPQIIMVRRNL